MILKGGAPVPASRRAVKIVLYAFLLLLCTLLQMSLLPAWRVAGVHPLWLPVLAVMIAVREGERLGLGFGLAAGLLCDLLLPRSEGFFTVFLMAAGLLAGALCEHVLTRGFVAALLWSLAVFAAMDVLFFVLFYLLPGRAGWGALVSVALPETLFSVTSGLWLYLPVKGIHRIAG
ncbi:MAG: rod shape-determining protein MreD [Oscillospiraceae bacterium]|nr:rod shape-determining protein MreD [Oscillospiraceae bacterium]